MKYDAILFDLDGTLIDSAPDLIQTLYDLLSDYQRPHLPSKQLRPLISYGSTALLKAGFNGDYPCALEELRIQFLERYKTQNTVHTDFFPGVPELLCAIEESGVPWGIITNKLTDCTEKIVSALDITTRAQAIVCGDTLPVAKPDPAPLFLACRTIAVNPSRCIYIGDCERDIEAGKRAGMDTIACEYGYINTQTPVNQWGATYSVTKPADIAKIIF